MARAHGARAQMALAFETVYGTPHGSGYQLLPVTAHQRPVGRETGEMPLTINEGIAWRLQPASDLVGEDTERDLALLLVLDHLLQRSRDERRLRGEDTCPDLLRQETVMAVRETQRGFNCHESPHSMTTSYLKQLRTQSIC